MAFVPQEHLNQRRQFSTGLILGPALEYAQVTQRLGHGLSHLITAPRTSTARYADTFLSIYSITLVILHGSIAAVFGLGAFFHSFRIGGDREVELNSISFCQGLV